jgi:hypothetical protein
VIFQGQQLAIGLGKGQCIGTQALAAKEFGGEGIKAEIRYQVKSSASDNVVRRYISGNVHCLEIWHCGDHTLQVIKDDRPVA